MNEVPTYEALSHISIFKMRKGRLARVKPLAPDPGEELGFFLDCLCPKPGFDPLYPAVPSPCL